MEGEIGWTNQMKQNNMIMLRTAKHSNWDTQLRHICETLEKANVKYLNPGDFFPMFMPLYYQPYDDLQPDELPGMHFPFDHVQGEALFFKTLRYWLVFHFTEQHIIPPVLFGSFWYGLANRLAHPNDLFDKSFRIFSKEIIRITCLTNGNKSDHHLYESGYEYVAVSGILSGLLRGYVDKEDFAKTWVQDLDFLEFFHEMTQKLPFSWVQFFQTKENAERFCFLLQHLLRCVIRSQDQAKDYFEDQIRQNQPVCLSHVETLLVHPTLPLFQVLSKIWKQIGLPQIIDAILTKLPTTSSFFENVSMKRFKPTVCSFTMKIANDPYTKNDSRIIFFAQFDGFHPSFWLPTSKSNLASMTVHGLKMDKHVVEFLKQEHLLVSLKEFSPCKLQKQKRLSLILQSLAKEKTSILHTQSNLSKVPWFTHEKQIFSQLENIPRFSLEYTSSPIPGNMNYSSILSSIDFDLHLPMSDVGDDLFLFEETM